MGVLSPLGGSASPWRVPVPRGPSLLLAAGPALSQSRLVVRSNGRTVGEPQASAKEILLLLPSGISLE